MRDTPDTASYVLPPPVGTLRTALGTGPPHPSLRGENGIAARDAGNLPSSRIARHASWVKSGIVRARSVLSAANSAIPSDRTDATLYACRDWIEQGFRGLKRAGWQWQRTRRTDPVRAGRHWLVMAVATLLVAYGTRREEAAALGRTPARLRTPPATVPALSVPRRLSLLRQGLTCLGPLLVQGRLWTRVWLRPRPGPYGPPGVRALAQGP